MDNDHIIAQQNLENASERLKKVDSSVADLINNMRGKSMNFYNRLSLMAGGVLSLSITYIGYLASVPNRQFSFAELLFLGWIFLLVAIFAGMYRNHFNLDMGHYQAINILNDARLQQYKASLTMLENYPHQFANLKTTEDVEKQIEVTKNNISLLEKAINTNKSSEKRESFLWLTCQSATHISFFLGIVLITVFAALNLPVNIEFTIWQSLTGK
ncbi:MAG: hypothetical protein WC220_05545 [Pedobacter sp.]|jgi:hypothetical protein